MKTGEIIVLSGPSGVGKTTLYHRLLSDLPESLAFSVSATTRAPRTGEEAGKDYYYLSHEDFQTKIRQSDFIEWAQVHGNFYGTLKTEVSRIGAEGKNSLLDIDVQGGMNIKQLYPHSHLIFILPPTTEILKERISNRKTDSVEVIETRLKNALGELKFAPQYDYQVVNDVLEEAYQRLKGLVLGLIS